MAKNISFDLKKVSKLLLDNKIIAFPTETVYGILGIVNPDNKRKINTIKERKEDQNLQVSFPDLEEVYKWANISSYQKSILESELPGNKSFVLSSSKLGKEKIGEPTILVRVPSVVVAKDFVDLLKYVGPVYSTSANLHNEGELENYKEISKTLAVDYVIRSENYKKTKSSQIFSLINDNVKLIR